MKMKKLEQIQGRFYERDLVDNINTIYNSWLSLKQETKNFYLSATRNDNIV